MVITMKGLLIISLITLATTEECNHVIGKSKYSRKEILKIEGIPTNLAFNRKTGQLFFTLVDIPSLINSTYNETKMDEYVIKDGKPIKISNFNGQTAFVDDEKGTVYFGSDKGIYVYDDWTTSALPVTLFDKDIVQLYKRPNSTELYAVTYPSQEVNIIIDGEIKYKFDGISANIIAVDSEGNLFFHSDDRGVAVLLKDFVEPIQYLGLRMSSGRVLAYDGARILIATVDGMYQLFPDNVVPKKLANFDFVPSGLIVVGSEYYVATAHKIFKYSEANCG